MRVGVFVNISNQFAAISLKKKGYRVNYANYLKRVLDEQDKLVIAIAYGSQVNNEASRFIYVLKKQGYVTKFVVSMQQNSQDIIQPDRNVEMTIDILGLKDKVDKIIIGSNQVELVPLIHYLQMTGVKVNVISPALSHQEGTINMDILNDEDIVEYIQSMREKKK